MKTTEYRRQRGGRGAMGVLAAGALLGLLATSAPAIPPGDIVLGNVTVMRIRTPSGSLTVQQRADAVQERINQVLAVPNLVAKDVIVKPDPRYGPTIFVHGIKVITIDPDTAKDSGMTADVLAKSWAHRIMGVIADVGILIPKPSPLTPEKVIAADAPPPTPPAAAAEEKAEDKSDPAAKPAPTPPVKPDAPPPTSPTTVPPPPAAPPVTTPAKTG